MNFSQMIQAVYKGQSSNELVMAYFDGKKWTGNTPIALMPGNIDPYSDQAPAVASYNNLLYIVYKGESSNTLYCAWYDGLTWYGNQPIQATGSNPNPKSNMAPALAVLNGRLYCVYKGESSTTLWWMWYDGTWHDNEPIVCLGMDPNPASTTTPAISEYAGKLYVVNKGMRSNTLWSFFFNGTTWEGNQTIKSNGPDPDPRSDQAPALASFNGRLYMAYKGQDSTNLWSTWFDGQTWHDNAQIKCTGANPEPKSTDAPALIPFNGRLVVVNKGESSGDLWSFWTDGTTWQGNQTISSMPGGLDPQSNKAPAGCVFKCYDRSTWMTGIRSLIGDRTLKQIVIPGSHDSGTDVFNATTYGNQTNTRTQTLSIAGQLQAGCRYFDLRPVRMDDTHVFYTAHITSKFGGWVAVGATGESLPTVFESVANFLANSEELVILKFGHYFENVNQGWILPSTLEESIPEGYYDDLCKLIQQYLGVYLFQPVPGTDVDTLQLSNLTFNTFFRGRVGGPGPGTGRVLPVLDDLPTSVRAKYPGIYSYKDFSNAPVVGNPANLRCYDNYSGTEDLGKMVDEQINQLNDATLHGDNLFLLSWTLTLGDFHSIAATVLPLNSILNFARQANGALWFRMAATYGIVPPRKPPPVPFSRIPNVLYVDDFGTFATDTAVWLNQVLTPP